LGLKVGAQGKRSQDCNRSPTWSDYIHRCVLFYLLLSVMHN
jgi:hypothetical protein